jgi:hypothetical protein
MAKLLGFDLPALLNEAADEIIRLRREADELHKRRLELALDVDIALSLVPSSPDGLELAMADMLFLGPEIADALRGKPFAPTMQPGNKS